MSNSALHRTSWDGRAYKRNKVYQPGHGFMFGDVVRFDAAQEKFVLADAGTPEDAEAIGIVTMSGSEPQATDEYLSRAHPSPLPGRARKDFFSVVYRGEITIPYSTDYSNPKANDFVFNYEQGKVYFLDPVNRGKLTTTRPRTFGSSTIKPMLVSLGERKAIAVNYVGRVLIDDATENVTVNYEELQNAGDIHPVFGQVTSTDYKYCDGSLLSEDRYPELFKAIQDKVEVKTKEIIGPHYAGVTGSYLVSFNGSVAEGAVGGGLIFRPQPDGTPYQAFINNISGSSDLVVYPEDDFAFQTQFGGTSKTAYVQGHSQHYKRVFFIPDLTDRILSGTQLTGSFEVGQVGGDNVAVLTGGTDIQGASGLNTKNEAKNRMPSLDLNFYIRTKISDCDEHKAVCCGETLSPHGDNKNAVINGAFNVWERGDVFGLTGDGATQSELFCSPQYTADRWYRDFRFDSNKEQMRGGVVHLRNTEQSAGFEADIDRVPNDIADYARFSGYTDVVNRGNQESFNQTYHVFENRIEDARTFNGNRVCLSFYIR